MEISFNSFSFQINQKYLIKGNDLLKYWRTNAYAYSLCHLNYAYAFNF